MALIIKKQSSKIIREVGNVIIINAGAADKASQAEAEAGTEDTKYLTPSTGFNGWLSWVANKTVSGLNTTLKTIVGAINEVRTTANSAQSTASTALSNANTAQSSADTALSIIGDIPVYKVTAAGTYTSFSDVSTAALAAGHDYVQIFYDKSTITTYDTLENIGADITFLQPLSVASDSYLGLHYAGGTYVLRGLIDINDKIEVYGYSTKNLTLFDCSFGRDLSLSPPNNGSLTVNLYNCDCSINGNQIPINTNAKGYVNIHGESNITILSGNLFCTAFNLFNGILNLEDLTLDGAEASTIQGGKVILSSGATVSFDGEIEIYDGVVPATTIDSLNVGSGTVTDLRAGAGTPVAHATSHTDGTDDIQSATNVQKGLATAAHIAAIEANSTHRTSDGKNHSDVVLNNTHRVSTSNPHGVTKSQVGLGSVPNTDFTAAVAANTAAIATKADKDDTIPNGEFLIKKTGGSYEGSGLDAGDLATAISISGTHPEATSAIDFSTVQGKSITLTADRSYTITGLSASNPTGLLEITHAGFTPSFSGVTSLGTLTAVGTKYYLKFVRQASGEVTLSNQAGGPVSVGGSSLSASKVISATEILAMNATPIVVKAAPGATKFDFIRKAVAYINFEDDAYTTNTTLNLKSGSTVIGTCNCLGATASGMYEFDITGVPELNGALTVQTASGEALAGNSSLLIVAYYEVIDLSTYTFPDPPASVPDAPTSLTATENANGSTIDLAWTAPAGTVTGYKIEIRTNAIYYGGTWTTLVADTGNANVTYAHTSAPEGTNEYRVSAINGAGTGTASNVDSAIIYTLNHDFATLTWTQDNSPGNIGNGWADIPAASQNGTTVKLEKTGSGAHVVDDGIVKLKLRNYGGGAAGGFALAPGTYNHETELYAATTNGIYISAATPSANMNSVGTFSGTFVLSTTYMLNRGIGDAAYDVGIAKQKIWKS